LNTQLLTVKDIESRTKLGHTKMAELIRTGEIQTFKIGRRRLATEDALLEFIQRKMDEQAA